METFALEMIIYIAASSCTAHFVLDLLSFYTMSHKNKLPAIVRHEIMLKVEEIIVEERVRERKQGCKIAPCGYETWVLEYKLRGIAGVYTAKMLRSYTNNLLSRRRKEERIRLLKEEEKKKRLDEEVERIRMELRQEEDVVMKN